MCEDFSLDFETTPDWIYFGRTDPYPSVITTYKHEGHWSATGGRTAGGCLVSDVDQQEPGQTVADLLIDLGADCHFKKITFWDRTTAITGGNSFPHFITLFNAAGQTIHVHQNQHWQWTAWNQFVWDSAAVGGYQNVRYIRVTVVTTTGGGPLYIDDLEVQFM